MRQSSGESGLAGRLHGRVQQTSGRVVARQGSEKWIVFALSLGLNVGAAYLIAARSSLFVPEAMWYTVQGWLLLAGDVSRLSIFHSPLPPLPTALQLPLMLLPPFRANALAAIVVSAVSGALACGVLNGLLAAWNIRRAWRFAVVALFALNPLVLFHSSSGSPEMVAVLLTLMSVHFLASWYQTDSLQPLILLGFTLGALCLVRYDALIYALLMVGILWLICAKRGVQPAEHVLGILITCFVPAISTLGLGVLFSLLVELSPYSWAEGRRLAALQLPQLAADAAWMAPIPSGPHPASAAAQWMSTAALSLLLVAAGVLLLDGWATGDRLATSLATIALAFLAMEILEVRAGHDYLSWHGSLLTLSLGFVLASRVLARLATYMRGKQGALLLGKSAAVLALALSGFATGAAMAEAQEPDEPGKLFMRGLASAQQVEPWQEEREIAEYLLGHASERGVLVDDFEGYRIVFFTGKPEIFVTRGTPEFQPTLQAPIGRVDYLLVRNPQMQGVRDLVGSYYPALYELGANSTEMVGDWPGSGWRLYRLRARGTVS